MSEKVKDEQKVIDMFEYRVVVKKDMEWYEVPEKEKDPEEEAVFERLLAYDRVYIDALEEVCPGITGAEEYVDSNDIIRSLSVEKRYEVFKVAGRLFKERDGEPNE